MQSVVRKSRKVERILSALPELRRLTRAQLSDSSCPMSPAMFGAVVDGICGDSRGEVFMRSDVLDEALTAAGYWDGEPRDYTARVKHASVMIEYLKLAAVQGRRETRQLMKSPTTETVM